MIVEAASHQRLRAAKPIRDTTDDCARIIAGLSDEEIVYWHALFGSWPPIRLNMERRQRLEQLMRRVAEEKVGHVFSTKSSGQLGEGITDEP